jgi:hypothetical protein
LAEGAFFGGTRFSDPRSEFDFMECFVEGLLDFEWADFFAAMSMTPWRSIPWGLGVLDKVTICRSNDHPATANAAEQTNGIQ